MPAFIDHTGETFGKWTVLYRSGGRKRKSAHWICQCICGAIKRVDGQHLRDGKSTQCRKCVGIPRDGIPISSRHWQAILYGARSRGIEFKVTRKQVYGKFVKQKGLCALTGLPLCFSTNKGSRKDGTASLDRIDSSRAYMPSNIQWVHKDINLMKGPMSEDQFIHYCSLILSHREQEEIV